MQIRFYMFSESEMSHKMYSYNVIHFNLSLLLFECLYTNMYTISMNMLIFM